jgi:hypothetical protein
MLKARPSVSMYRRTMQVPAHPPSMRTHTICSLLVGWLHTVLYRPSESCFAAPLAVPTRLNGQFNQGSKPVTQSLCTHPKRQALLPSHLLAPTYNHAWCWVAPDHTTQATTTGSSEHTTQLVPEVQAGVLCSYACPKARVSAKESALQAHTHTTAVHCATTALATDPAFMRRHTTPLGQTHMHTSRRPPPQKKQAQRQLWDILSQADAVLQKPHSSRGGQPFHQQ